MQRRTVLEWGVNLVGLAVAGVLSIPGLLAVLAPAWSVRREPLWRPVGRLDDFRTGTVTPAVVDIPRRDAAGALRQQTVYLWRPDEGQVVVFSRNCTDLSCPVVYDPGSECFFCPCHGGIFAKNGDRLAGPPPRPLYRYAVRLRDGLVEIDLRSLPPMT